MLFFSLFAVGCRRERSAQTKTCKSKCVSASITQRSVQALLIRQVVVVCVLPFNLVFKSFLFYRASLQSISSLLFMLHYSRQRKHWMWQMGRYALKGFVSFFILCMRMYDMRRWLIVHSPAGSVYLCGTEREREKERDYSVTAVRHWLWV